MLLIHARHFVGLFVCPAGAAGQTKALIVAVLDSVALAILGVP
jgi:hypothetical protein